MLIDIRPSGSQSWGLVYQLLTAASISIGAWLVVDIFVLYMIYDMHIILIIIYVYVYIYIISIYA